MVLLLYIYILVASFCHAVANGKRWSLLLAKIRFAIPKYLCSQVVDF